MAISFVGVDQEARFEAWFQGYRRESFARTARDVTDRLEDHPHWSMGWRPYLREGWMAAIAQPIISTEENSMTKVMPTIGRRVLFHPAPNLSTPGFAPSPVCQAGVTMVHSDCCVDLDVIDANGAHHAMVYVSLIHHGEIAPSATSYCTYLKHEGVGAMIEKRR
jgi:hypothetical protein